MILGDVNGIKGVVRTMIHFSLRVNEARTKRRVRNGKFVNFVSGEDEAKLGLPTEPRTE